MTNARGCYLVVMLLAGCVSPGHEDPKLPGSNTIVREQLIIYSDFPLPVQHRLLEEACALRGDLAVRLDLTPSDEPIHVYLFDSAEPFHAFMRLHHPELPQRRAFFLESDTRLSVYAHWGDRVAEDLRHEVTHGYLHSVVPQLPLWLDEGLAEYFEVARGHGGFNRPHLDNLARRMVAGTWQPNLQRLEALTPPVDLTQLDYAESWAWTHMLLETTDERRQLLRDYFRELRERGMAAPISYRLRQSIPHPEAALIEHLREVARRADGHSIAQVATN